MIKQKKHRVVLFCFMVEVATPDSNHPRKSEIKPYVKRSFRTFLQEEIFEKNVKSVLKNARKATYNKS